MSLLASRPGRVPYLAIGAVALALGCATVVEPSRYRLTDAGDHWDHAGKDRVYDDLAPRYPAYFELILDPSKTHEPDLLPLRDDLERQPADRRNFDALNAIAIGYFELNYRAEADRGGRLYFGNSTRAAKLAAVPWRAYGEVREPALRDAILDFYADVASSTKLLSGRTAPRLVRTVESLRRKESDPERLSRIDRIGRRLAAAGEATP